LSSTSASAARSIDIPAPPKGRLSSPESSTTLRSSSGRKYATFVIGSIDAAANAIGAHLSPPILDIALPVGISFYTFMSISYLVDVFRNGGATDSLVNYATYMSLFPHLVAGPIVR
jgi:hypothetical protein